MNKIIKAARSVIESWDRRSCGEIETQKTVQGFTFWSPASSMVDSSAIHQLRVELDRIESEKPDVCKTDCEFYEGCLETFTHKKPEKPGEELFNLAKEIYSAGLNRVMMPMSFYAGKIEQFAERYCQSRRKEENDADAISVLNHLNSRDQSRMGEK